MGYSKFIRSGNILEAYDYERNISNNLGGNRQRRRALVVEDSGMFASDRENSLQKRTKERRQSNARRTCVFFTRIVLSNLTGSEFPYFVTLTYREVQRSLEVGYYDFKLFVQSLRYKFGCTFKYIVVPEFQKRGSLHFHCLLWGLPESIFKQERETRFLAGLWGKGFIDCFKTDGNEKVAYYMAKYMSKTFVSSLVSSSKAYRCSRNILRPDIVSGVSIDDTGDEILGVDNPPCEDREFLTQWLGKGRYRKYNI